MKTAVIALAFAATGCSVLVMKKPVDRRPAPPDCIASKWAPGYDLFAVGASLAVAATAKSEGGGHGARMGAGDPAAPVRLVSCR